MTFSLFDRIRGFLNPHRSPSRAYAVVTQQWDQFESGWGRTSGGYSVHLTEAHRLRFVAEQDALNKTSPTYFIPDSVPVAMYVDKATYKKVKAARNGMWWPDASLPASWVRKQSNESRGDVAGDH